MPSVVFLTNEEEFEGRKRMTQALYVGLDVHKDMIAVAVAEEGRRGEVRFFLASLPTRLILYCA